MTKELENSKFLVHWQEARDPCIPYSKTCLESRATLGIKLQAEAVDAVTKSGWVWPIVEDVAEMRVAVATNHLHADHPVRDVGPGHHVRLIAAFRTKTQLGFILAVIPTISAFTSLL